MIRVDRSDGLFDLGVPVKKAVVLFIGWLIHRIETRYPSVVLVVLRGQRDPVYRPQPPVYIPLPSAPTA